MLMRRFSQMAAAFIVRLVTTFGLLLLLIAVAWTTLFISTRFSSRLFETPVYSHLDSTDNRTWKSTRRLLTAGTDGRFYLNGKPRRLISGEFHYFRVHPSQWNERLRRMRTAGLNTITTRVPWNFHERRQSVFQFHGMWNLADFIRLVHRLGFLLIVHVGPYIDADWEFGGLPSWLLWDRHMMVRTSNYQPFLEFVRRYFEHLLPLLDRSTYRKHGPVIALQVENEFGSYGHDDGDYLRQLVGLIRGHGIRELILTADRGSHLRDGAVPGALATVTCHSTVDEVASALSSLSFFQPDLPRLVTLLDANGTSRWGEPQRVHQHSVDASVANFRRSVDLVLASNASVNVYAFAGGTNFGMWNGAIEDSGTDAASVNVVRQAVRRRGRHRQRRGRQQQTADDVVSTSGATSSSGLVYRPATTAYNYGSPAIISQSGHSEYSLKYHAFRRLLLQRGLISRMQAVPANPASLDLGLVHLSQRLYWDNLLDLIPNSPIVLESPVYMEQLNTQLGSGQDFGWIVYRTRIPSGGSHLNISGTMRDRAQLFVDGQLVETVYNNRLSPFVVTTTINPSRRHTNGSTSDATVLELVVENMGRSSFGLLDDQRKGFEGLISVDGKPVHSHWDHYSIDFSNSLITAIKHSTDWIPTGRPSTLGQRQPTIYRGHFKVRQIKDTYIDLSKWRKGLVIVNGFVLGRYWNVGPQQSLYVPSPILSHGSNEVMVFELERTWNAKVKFVASLWSDHHKHRG